MPGGCGTASNAPLALGPQTPRSSGRLCGLTPPPEVTLQVPLLGPVCLLALALLAPNQGTYLTLLTDPHRYASP